MFQDVNKRKFNGYYKILLWKNKTAPLADELQNPIKLHDDDNLSGEEFNELKALVLVLDNKKKR